jgi:hypothetical protein
MCPVKASAPGADLGISPHLADPILVKRLNEQNIWQVLSTLPGQYSKQDVIDHLKFKHSQLFDLIQDYKTMSMYSEPPEFGPKLASNINQDNQLTEQEQQDLAAMFKMMGKSAKSGKKSGKFTVAPKAAEGAKDSKAVSGEVVAEGEALVDEYETWMVEFEQRLFDIQLQQDMEAKNEELKAELQRIIEMVRSGKIDAVWLLVALAKVNSSRNGLLFTQFGKKLHRYNDQATKVTEELYSRNPADPQYAAYLQMTSQKQKEITFQQQFLIQDMQKLTQNIEKVLTFAKTQIEAIFRTRLHMLNAPFRNL